MDQAAHELMTTNEWQLKLNRKNHSLYVMESMIWWKISRCFKIAQRLFLLKCPEIMKPLSSELQYVLSLPNSWLGSDTNLMRNQGRGMFFVMQRLRGINYFNRWCIQTPQNSSDNPHTHSYRTRRLFLIFWWVMDQCGFVLNCALMVNTIQSL